jgi:TPR repeat protein
MALMATWEITITCRDGSRLRFSERRGGAPQNGDILLTAMVGARRRQRELGFMYYNGLGVPEDYAEAAKWYRLA